MRIRAGHPPRRRGRARDGEPAGVLLRLVRTSPAWRHGGVPEHPHRWPRAGARARDHPARVAVVGEECLHAFAAPEVHGRVPLWSWADAEKPAEAEWLRAGDPRPGALRRRARDNPDPPGRTGLTAGPCVYIFTSGTTGLPKAAIISHARWMMSGAVMGDTMGIESRDCFYTFRRSTMARPHCRLAPTALPPAPAWRIRRKFSRREFWADVRRRQVTVCQYIGEICCYLLSGAEHPDDRRHGMRTMVGAGLSPEVWSAASSASARAHLRGLGSTGGQHQHPQRRQPVGPAAACRSGRRPTCAWCATTSRPTRICATPTAA